MNKGLSVFGYSEFDAQGCKKLVLSKNEMNGAEKSEFDNISGYVISPVDNEGKSSDNFKSCLGLIFEAGEYSFMVHVDLWFLFRKENNIEAFFYDIVNSLNRLKSIDVNNVEINISMFGGYTYFGNNQDDNSEGIQDVRCLLGANNKPYEVLYLDFIEALGQFCREEEIKNGVDICLPEIFDNKNIGKRGLVWEDGKTTYYTPFTSNQNRFINTNDLGDYKDIINSKLNEPIDVDGYGTVSEFGVLYQLVILGLIEDASIHDEKIQQLHGSIVTCDRSRK